MLRWTKVVAQSIAILVGAQVIIAAFCRAVGYLGGFGKSEAWQFVYGILAIVALIISGIATTAWVNACYERFTAADKKKEEERLALRKHIDEKVGIPDPDQVNGLLRS